MKGASRDYRRHPFCFDLFVGSFNLSTILCGRYGERIIFARVWRFAFSNFHFIKKMLDYMLRKTILGCLGGSRGPLGVPLGSSWGVLGHPLVGGVLPSKTRTGARPELLLLFYQVSVTFYFFPCLLQCSIQYLLSKMFRTTRGGARTPPCWL